MSRIRLMAIGCMLLSMPLMSEAAWVQYRTDNFNVVGVFATEADMRLDANTAPLEMPGVAVADVVWPAPASCVKGKKEWTRVTAPGELPLVLKPTLVFFRCTIVKNRATLYAALHQEIKRASGSYIDGVGDFTMTIVHEADRLCPTGDNSANCPEIRTAAATVESSFRSKGQFRTGIEAAAVLAAEAETIRTTQGW